MPDFYATPAPAHSKVEQAIANTAMQLLVTNSLFRFREQGMGFSFSLRSQIYFLPVDWPDVAQVTETGLLAMLD